MAAVEHERQTIIRACCNAAPYCRWTYNGQRSYIEAEDHAARTGHTAVVTEEVRTVFKGSAR